MSDQGRMKEWGLGAGKQMEKAKGMSTKDIFPNQAKHPVKNLRHKGGEVVVFGKKKACVVGMDLLGKLPGSKTGGSGFDERLARSG